MGASLVAEVRARSCAGLKPRASSPRHLVGGLAVAGGSRTSTWHELSRASSLPAAVARRGRARSSCRRCPTRMFTRDSSCVAVRRSGSDRPLFWHTAPAPGGGQHVAAIYRYRPLSPAEATFAFWYPALGDDAEGFACRGLRAGCRRWRAATCMPIGNRHGADRPGGADHGPGWSSRSRQHRCSGQRGRRARDRGGRMTAGARAHAPGHGVHASSTGMRRPPYPPRGETTIQGDTASAPADRSGSSSR